jgi:hypothetical protein
MRLLPCLFVLAALLAHGLRADGQEFAPFHGSGSPAVEQEPPAPPPWFTLPHASSWEQLWQPGDLVQDTYYLRRPWHAGFFFGTMDGDSLTSEVNQASDWFGGFRYGNDFSPTWGWELRTAFFEPKLTYADEPERAGFARDWFLDASFLHYPFGDTRIRPFWSIGLGGSQFKFTDERNRGISEWLVDLPLSIGCKYYWKPWLVLRGELADTIVFGNDNVDTQNNLSFSVGAEVHWHSFKSRPVKYSY